MSRLAPIFLATCVLSIPAAGQVPFGTATPVGAHPPRLLSETPYLGNSGFGYRVDGGPSGGSGVLGVSLGTSTLALGNLVLFIDLSPGALVYLEEFPLGADGSAFIPRPLTGVLSPAFAGLSWYAQAAVAEGPLATSLRLSNAVRLEMQLPPQMFFGGAGTHFLVDVLALQIAGTFALATPLLRSGVYGNGGRDLFVTEGIAVWHFDTTAPTLAPVQISSGPTLGFDDFRWDAFRKRLGVRNLVGEIAFYDGDPQSPGFGSLLSETSGLSVVSVQGSHSWSLSADGSRAVLPLVITSTKYFIVLDTDPASPAFQTVISSGTSPAYNGPVVPPFTSQIPPADTFISADGRFVLFNRGTTLDRYEIASQSFVDHNPQLPGVQGLGPDSLPPVPGIGFATRSHFSIDGSFAIIPAGAGLFQRLDFGPADPSQFAVSSTSVNTGGAQFVYLLPDRRTVAALQYTNFGFSFPIDVRFYDLTTGTAIGTSPVTITAAGSSVARAVAFR